MARGERDGIDEIEGNVIAHKAAFSSAVVAGFYICQLSFPQIPILQIGK